MRPLAWAAVVGGLLLAAGHAQAAGCNGHVNVAEWGCAPWDNNNGPQFPHYVAPAKPAAHVTPAPPLVKPAPPKVVANPHAGPPSGNGNGIMTENGAGIISDKSGGLISRAR